jgi:hypothetical protein
MPADFPVEDGLRESTAQSGLRGLSWSWPSDNHVGVSIHSGELIDGKTVAMPISDARVRFVVRFGFRAG